MNGMSLSLSSIPASQTHAAFFRRIDWLSPTRESIRREVDTHPTATPASATAPCA